MGWNDWDKKYDSWNGKWGWADSSHQSKHKSRKKEYSSDYKKESGDNVVCRTCAANNRVSWVSGSKVISEPTCKFCSTPWPGSQSHDQMQACLEALGGNCLDGLPLAGSTPLESNATEQSEFPNHLASLCASGNKGQATVLQWFFEMGQQQPDGKKFSIAELLKHFEKKAKLESSSSLYYDCYPDLYSQHAAEGKKAADKLYHEQAVHKRLLADHAKTSDKLKKLNAEIEAHQLEMGKLQEKVDNATKECNEATTAIMHRAKMASQAMGPTLPGKQTATAVGSQGEDAAMQDEEEEKKAVTKAAAEARVLAADKRRRQAAATPVPGTTGTGSQGQPKARDRSRSPLKHTVKQLEEQEEEIRRAMELAAAQMEKAQKEQARLIQRQCAVLQQKATLAAAESRP